MSDFLFPNPSSIIGVIFNCKPLESELANREPTQPETSATVGTDLSKVEAADLLNKLKARRKKSKSDLLDMEAVLEILLT